MRAGHQLAIARKPRAQGLLCGPVVRALRPAQTVRPAEQKQVLRTFAGVEEAAERLFPGLLAVERARAHVQTHHAAYMAPQPCLACEPGEEALRQRDARLLMPEGADPPVDHGGGADLAEIVA